jgi:hypothetical protein
LNGGSVFGPRESAEMVFLDQYLLIKKATLKGGFDWIEELAQA